MQGLYCAPKMDDEKMGSVANPFDDNSNMPKSVTQASQQPSYAALGVLQSSNVKFSWSKCDRPGDKTTVDSMDFTGTKLGSPMSIHAQGTFGSSANAGSKYNLAVKFNGSSVYAHSDDLCSDTTVKLPYGVGSFSMQGMGCP